MENRLVHMEHVALVAAGSRTTAHCEAAIMVSLFEQRELCEGETYVPVGATADHRNGYMAVYRQLPTAGWGVSYEPSDGTWCRFLYPRKSA